MYTPMLKNHVNGWHGNHAFFHSANQFIFEPKVFAFHPFDTHEKLSWGCEVGQISSRNIISLILGWVCLFKMALFHSKSSLILPILRWVILQALNSFQDVYMRVYQKLPGLSS